MTTESETQIKELQKRIVKALETGRDPTPIQKELGQLRAKIAAEAEMEELKKIVDKRQELRNKAEALKLKVQQQDEAIDNFLKARDSIIESLATILVKVRELPKIQDECYRQFQDAGQLLWITKLPEGYLPKGLTVPMLEVSSGMEYGNDKSAQAVFYITSAMGFLQSLVRKESPILERPPDEFETIDNEPETPQKEITCCVCNHEKVADINKALASGISLRDIEVRFPGISRSSLSRHRQHMSN